MSLPSQGWYPDPSRPDQLRWWDGSAWTAQVSRNGVPDTQPLPGAAPVRTGGGLPWWVWLLIGVGAVALLILVSPLLAVVALVVLVTGIVALSKKTPTWMRFRSPAVAGVITGIAAVVLLVSGSVAAVVYPTEAANSRQPLVAAGSTFAPTPTPATTASASPDEDASPAPFTGATTTVAAASATDGVSALALLATLPVKGRAPMTGYARSDFGDGWVDIDHNGCDTRNDILARDLSASTRTGSCTITTGTLDDPYTATEVDFERGAATSDEVQIDHVVALGDAWQTGAQQLTADQRIMLANDPMNLLAVSRQQNEQKGDGDAATWLPKSKAYRCAYVARQVSVKATYGLWVTSAEHDAIAGILSTCPNQPAVTSTYAAKIQPTPSTPAATTQPTQQAAPPSQAAPPAAPAPAAPAPAPQPAQPAPQPAQPAAPPQAPGAVTPGAFCAKADAGWIGYTVDRVKMICETSATDTRLRWRQA
jgi:hypothetical protein